MKILFKERLFSRYIYINSDELFLILSVANGDMTGLENTCQTGHALLTFWGCATEMNSPNSAKKELEDYEEALKSDLSWPGIGETIAQQKKERLEQIRVYLQALDIIEKSPQLRVLNGVFPSYPKPLKKMLQDKNSNLYSIILRPTVQDAYLRLAARPLFSVAHDSQAQQKFNTVSVLQQALINRYQGLSITAYDVKSQLIEQVLAQEFDHSDLNLLQAALHQEVKAVMGVEIDFNRDASGKSLDKERIDKAMMFDSLSTPREYIEALLGYCASALMDTIVESPFKRFINAEQWSIATQFLLAIASLYCVSESRMSLELNWGALLDEHPELSESLAQTMAQAQQDKQSPEEQLLRWINSQYSLFGLKTALSSKEIEIIKNDFAVRYAQVKESLHFDEFLLLDTRKKGAFVVHQNSIGVSFAEFAISEEFKLPPNLALPLEKLCNHFKKLDLVEIPHHNPVQRSVELDLSVMDDQALQALYARIHTEKDQTLRAQLLAQFKQEQPAFKPRIDLGQFLQHVAYGEQNQAEAFLKKYPDRTQELLMASTIPFTDYSGRTFNCTAYEYAYWAKDSHMCRMLEKYMDEHSGHALLKRIQLMEEAVQAATLFSKRPRGLSYVKNGTEYSSAHFELKPLIKALQHYVDEYDKKPEEPDEDWIKALNTIWIEEVGQEQLKVPAHIAQEYCQPLRSFDMLNKNKLLLDSSEPTNLQREVRYYNWNTFLYDFWFRQEPQPNDSGVGGSVAILRGSLPVGCQGRCVTKAWWNNIAAEARIDLAALMAIDEVRTKDLKQSRANLGSLSFPQASPPCP